DLYYSGGLLPPGAHTLPRDHDLDVVEAVALVRGPLINGDFGGSNLSGDLVRPGIGNPSAPLVVVVRRAPGGGQVPVKGGAGRRTGADQGGPRRRSARPARAHPRPGRRCADPPGEAGRGPGPLLLADVL